MELNGLAQLTYPGGKLPLVGPDIKLTVCSAQKTTFAEIVAIALVQETARTISRPQVTKVRKIKVAEMEEGHSNKFKK